MICDPLTRQVVSTKVQALRRLIAETAGKTPPNVQALTKIKTLGKRASRTLSTVVSGFAVHDSGIIRWSQ